MEEIKGIVSKVIFASNDGNFGVFILTTDEGSISVTLNGLVPAEGEEVKVKGEWVTHPKYGKQIKAISCISIIPTNAKDILRFLSSGHVEGIGPATAEKIVNEFGADTINVMLKTPEKLLKIPKIGEKTLAKICDSMTEQMELMELCIWLEEHELSSSLARRLYARFGKMAVTVIENKPYSLISEVSSIGFLTADKIAQKIGFGPEDRERIKAGIYYTLNQVTANGHCCLPKVDLLARATTLLGIDRELVVDVYHAMVQFNYLYVEDYQDNQLVYAKSLYKAENNVARSLLEIQSKAKPVSLNNPDDLIRKWELHNGIRLAPQQIQAIKSSLEYGVLVITGGPGTGKTTIIKGIISLLSRLGLDITLAAPTGRAARRMAETCSMKASTIHRLLVGKNNGEDITDFDDEMEQLETDVVIVDEMSMVDVILMDTLLKAIPLGCRLVLVGDVDQLPAVGAGSVLKDIIKSQRINTIKLNEVFRQSEESNIITNAHLINRGIVPQLEPKKDFQFIEMDSNEAMAEEILRLCQKDLAEQGHSVFKDIQILTPMHKLACGVENLNNLLQDKLNPPSSYKFEMRYGSKLFRVGDKVMHIKNNYVKNVFNGDVGYIVDMTATEVIVGYPDQDVTYEKEDLAQLTLAYAVSVHKSQGSEYPIVILPISMSHYIMLQRNLLYTAITRAKSKVIIIGSQKALQIAVSNNKTQHRYTLLADRLAQKLD